MSSDENLVQLMNNPISAIHAITAAANIELAAAGIFNVFRMGRTAILQYIIGMVVLFASLSIHEYAHAWVAYKLGDTTARDAGRLTINPLVHMDLMGTLFILLGAPVGWAKPVPINPGNFDRKHSVKKGIALVSIAGPISNLIMAFFAYLFLSITWVVAIKTGVLYGTAGSSFAISLVEVLALIFTLFYYRNLFLAIFNLLPVPPLDGFKVMGTALPNRIYYKLLQYERQIGMLFLLVLIFGRGGLGNVLEWLSTPFQWLIATPINALMNLIVG